MALRTVTSSLTRALARPAFLASSALRTTRPVVSAIANPIRAYSTEEADFASYPTPIFHLTETEQMLQETVARFSQEVVLPRVRDMDEAETMEEGVIEGLFENGLMSVEIPEEFGGAGMTFGGAIVAIEELAKVDPSVSIPKFS